MEQTPIEEAGSPQAVRPWTVMGIQKLVATYFGVEVLDLKSKARRRAVSHPRQVAVYLIKKFFGERYSYPWIGGRFGGRDHSTMIHAYRCIEEGIGKNPTLHHDVMTLWHRITLQGPPQDGVDFVIEPKVRQEKREPDFPQVVAVKVPELPRPKPVLASAEVRRVVADHYSVEIRYLEDIHDDEYYRFCREVLIFLLQYLERQGVVIGHDQFCGTEEERRKTYRYIHGVSRGDREIRSDIESILATLDKLSIIP